MTDTDKLLERLDSRLSNRWKLAGENDPHDSRYLCLFQQIIGEENTDDELANEVFLNPSIEMLAFAKDRIRWQSRRLDEAAAAIRSLQSELTTLKAQVDDEFNAGMAEGLRWAAEYAYSDEAKREILLFADNHENGNFTEALNLVRNSIGLTRPTKPTEPKDGSHGAK